MTMQNNADEAFARITHFSDDLLELLQDARRKDSEIDRLKDLCETHIRTADRHLNETIRLERCLRQCSRERDEFRSQFDKLEAENQKQFQRAEKAIEELNELRRQIERGSPKLATMPIPPVLKTGPHPLSSARHINGPPLWRPRQHPLVPQGSVDMSKAQNAAETPAERDEQRGVDLLKSVQDHNAWCADLNNNVPDCVKGSDG